MTPFDCASLSLNGSELRPPTVGGSPLASGGHAAASPGDGLAGCASDILAPATITNAAMSGIAARKVCSSCLHMPVNVEGLPDVPVRSPGQAGNAARGFAIETRSEER